MPLRRLHWKERTILASRYHRAISADVICNNKRKRLRGIRRTLSGERISNGRTPAPRALSSSVLPRDESVRIICGVEAHGVIVFECRADEKCGSDARPRSRDNFNRLLISNAIFSARVLTGVLLGQGKFRENPSWNNVRCQRLVS
jgi:hypothetical protein